MKMYPVEFEVFDEIEDKVATFKAFDGDCLEIELKHSIWTADELHKLADAYKIAITQLIEGVEV